MSRDVSRWDRIRFRKSLTDSDTCLGDVRCDDRQERGRPGSELA